MAAPRTARSRRTRAAIVDAVREELRRTGAFTVDRVVERVGCAPATYFTHFASKEDALAVAYGGVLADLERLTIELFDVDELRLLGPRAFATFAERELVRFFQAEWRTFNAALARISENRGVRDRHRAAEDAIHGHVARFLAAAERAGIVPGPAAASRASAVIVLTQGFNNPHLLRARADDPMHAVLANSLATALTGQ